MTGYEVKIIEASKELTARERLMLKDTSNAISIDEVTQNPDSGALVIKVDHYAALAVHNEKSDNKDYIKYVLVDESGNKYVTGSESFWEAFKSIWDEMHDTDEEYSIEIYRLESKNYKGKSFITCSIV
jgi:SAM-dependent MidA family methyltransferase